jgi:hypothetical protein
MQKQAVKQIFENNSMEITLNALKKALPDGLTKAA